MNSSELLLLFAERAESVGARVFTVPTMADAVVRILQSCMDKAPCERLLPELESATDSGPLSSNGVPVRTERVLAAPGLPGIIAAALQAGCKDAGVRLVTDNLREWISGVDVGVNVALAGIANSGTCVLDTLNEDVRLSGMICETGVVLLDPAMLVDSLAATAPLLRRLHAGPGYVSYITGPSRTADIERVPAVGVHGSLDLHVILLSGVSHA